MITFNQEKLEIRITRDSQTGPKTISMGYLGESENQKLILTEEELLFVYESLNDYFKTTGRNKKWISNYGQKY